MLSVSAIATAGVGAKGQGDTGQKLSQRPPRTNTPPEPHADTPRTTRKHTRTTRRDAGTQAHTSKIQCLLPPGSDDEMEQRDASAQPKSGKEERSPRPQLGCVHDRNVHGNRARYRQTCHKDETMRFCKSSNRRVTWLTAVSLLRTLSGHSTSAQRPRRCACTLSDNPSLLRDRVNGNEACGVPTCYMKARPLGHIDAHTRQDANVQPHPKRRAVECIVDGEKCRSIDHENDARVVGAAADVRRLRVVKQMRC